MIVRDTEQYLEEYFVFFTQLVSLQKKLIPIFEASVTIEPLPAEHAEILAKPYPDVPLLSDTLLKVIRPEYTASEIMQSWPGHPFPSLTLVLPMLLWVKPRTGVMGFESQNWLFQMHGWNELSLQKLPSHLEAEVIEAIKTEEIDALRNVPRSVWESEVDELPHVDVTYLPGGQTDGVRPWAAYLYAQSVECKFGNIDEHDHETYLKALVEKKVLVEKFGDYFLAKGNE